MVEAPRATATPSNGKRDVVDINILRNMTPFSNRNDANADAAPARDDAPATKLKLVLNGVRTNGGGEGVAFITNESGQQSRYLVGDSINGVAGVSVLKIFADSVILRHNGIEERLFAADAEGERAIRVAGSPDPAVLRKAEEKAAEAQKAAAKEMERAQRTVEAVSNLSRAEVQQLFDWVRFDADTEGGAPGVTVFPLNADIFSRSGLQARDIVQSIGGVSIDEETDYARLLEDLEEEQSVQIMLLRGGRVVELTVSLTGS